MSLQTAGDFDSRFTTSNGAERGGDQLRFPDISVDFGQPATALHLTKFIKNPQMRSSASRQVSNDYANGRAVKTGVNTQIQYRPLLSLSGELPNGMRIELGTEHRHSDHELLQLGSSVQLDNNSKGEVYIAEPIPGTPAMKAGIKTNDVILAVDGKSIKIGINSQYERQTGGVVQNGIERNPVRRDRLSVNATGSYGFSSNVSGNATLGFSQDRDQLRAIVHRSVRIELSARFGL